MESSGYDAIDMENATGFQTNSEYPWRILFPLKYPDLKHCASAELAEERALLVVAEGGFRAADVQMKDVTQLAGGALPVAEEEGDVVRQQRVGHRHCVVL